MNKILLSLIVLLTILFVPTKSNAQLVSVSNGFATWLQGNGYAGCLSGNMLDGSCPLVINATKINCSYANIQDLSGLEVFQNLDTLIANYSGLTTISYLPNTLTYLELEYNSINTISSFPNSLLLIGIQYNQLESIPSLPTMLKYFDCSYNHLTALPSLPNSITQLDASYNSISTIYSLPDSALGINLSNNQFQSIPTLPQNLINLDVSSNSLNSLPQLNNLPQLNKVVCSNNVLTNIPILPNTLTELYCDFNSITSLPTLSQNLISLECNNNYLTYLPSLENLQYLVCSNNNLSNGLPTLPSTLKSLLCENDSLHTLPALNSNLQVLYCSNNLLDSIPTIYNQLYDLRCMHNQLTTLPNLPTNLKYLDCSFNNINNLPNLPQNLYLFLIRNNPNIMCLPAIEKFIGYGPFSIENTGIICLPNYIEHSYSIPSIDTLPLCGIFSNPNGCEIAWNVAGQIHRDDNSDCVRQTSEPAIEQVKVQLILAGVVVQQVYSNFAGFYSFNTDLNEYEIKIDTTNLPFDIICPNTNSYIFNPFGPDTLDFSSNFALQCKPGFDLTSRYIVHYNGLFFPNQVANVYFSAGDLAQYYGVNCNTEGLAGTIKAWFSGPESFNTIPQGWTLNNDTLSLALNDISQLNIEDHYHLSFLTDTFPPAGSQFCLTINIQANGIDNNPINNTITHCFDVINSFDPNFKEVYPSTVEEAGLWHTYTIHFQNTGTAPAINILLKDTLDSQLNWASFEKLGSSHTLFTQVLENGIVHFNFPNIFLADSTSNEPESHGWVQYRIKTKDDLSGVQTIHNKASIYFDFNEPVVTNDAIIRLCSPTQLYQNILLCHGDSLKVGNTWFINEGEYSTAMSSIYGCDSTVNTTLQFRSIIENAYTQQICQGESIIIDGITYDSAGVFSRIYSSVHGCDSTVTMTLILGQPATSTQHYTLCEGDTLILNNQTFTSADNFTTTYNSSFGCDSIVTTDITLLPVDFDVYVNDPVLSVIQGMQFYQWINCATNEPIEGASSQVFIPTSNGSYKVNVLTINGCIKTSDCYTISTLGIIELSPSDIRLYPNPANEQITIVHPQVSGQIYITDLAGRMVGEQAISNGSSTLINTTYLSSGNYLVKFVSNKFQPITIRFSVIK